MYDVTAGAFRRSYGGHTGHHRVPTHNDLPVPCGDWLEKHKAVNARYNVNLAASIVLLGSVLAYVSVEYNPQNCSLIV